MMYTLGTPISKEYLKGPVHNLGNRRVIEVRLPADRFDPALLDMEGDALSLPIALGRGGESCLPALPPVQELRECGNLRLGKWIHVDIGCAIGRSALTGEPQGFNPGIEGAFGDPCPMGDLTLGETFLLVKGLELGVSQRRAVHRGLHGDGVNRVDIWGNSGRSIHQVYTGGQGLCTPVQGV